MAVNLVPPHPEPYLHPHRRRLLPSWSEIPEELLWLILQRISDWGDLHPCLGVCPLWRSVARLVLRRIIATPCLLLINPEQKQEACKFLDLGTTTFCLKARTELTNYTLCNSNRGWLLMHSNTNRQEYRLYNPITRESVQLPPPPHGPFGILCSPSYPRPPEAAELEVLYFRLQKLVISTTSPRDPNCVVFVLFHHPNLLAFCKPASNNNNTFKVIKGSANHFVDMIFYKGELYAVNFFSELYVMRVLGGEGDNDEIVDVQEQQVVGKEIKKAANKGHEFYLVEEPVRKELLLVVKVKQLYWDRAQRKKDRMSRTVSFRIFKLKYYNNNYPAAKWEEVREFDGENHALVLVTGDSMFVSVVTDDDDDDQTMASSCSSSYKPNCIYFVDEFCNSHPLNYVKVYDLKTHTVEPFNFHPSYSNHHSQPLASDELCRWFRGSTL